jgi:hypothetical protein
MDAVGGSITPIRTGFWLWSLMKGADEIALQQWQRPIWQ